MAGNYFCDLNYDDKYGYGMVDAKAFLLFPWTTSIYECDDNNNISSNSDYFFNGLTKRTDNIFFEDAFQIYSRVSPNNLQFSLDIYDSILVTIPESALIIEAQFRLAEIQYRIIEDFDKASVLYINALSKNPPMKLKKNISKS